MNGTPIEKIRNERSQSYNDEIMQDDDDGLFDDPPVQQPQVQQQNKKEVINNVDKNVEITTQKNGLMNHIPSFLREPLIIILIYVLMSTDLVKQMIGSHIPQVKSSSDSGVHLTGVFIYGTIIAILFVVIKKLLL